MRNRTLVGLLACLGLPAAIAADQAVTPEVIVSEYNTNEWAPRAAYNSARDEFLVVWYVSLPGASPAKRVFARRLDRYGRPLGETFDLRPDGDTHDRREPSVTYDSVHDRWLVVYGYDYWGNGSDWDIRGRFLDWNGLRPDWQEFALATTGLNERAPAVAFDLFADRFLASWWREDLSSWSTVWGAVFGFGDAVTPFGISITANRTSPAISFDPFAERFLVAYDTPFDVYAALVDPTGGVGGETAVATTSEAELAPGAASCDNWQHLVAWESQAASGKFNVLAQFLYGSGALDGGAIVLGGTTADELEPSVDCLHGGIDYLVAYRQEWAGGSDGISARRLAATHALADEFVVIPPPASGWSSHPAVAGGRSGWLIVWEHLRPEGSYLDIHARVAWDLFADGFEWGSTANWSATSP